MPNTTVRRNARTSRQRSNRHQADAPRQAWSAEPRAGNRRRDDDRAWSEDRPRRGKDRAEDRQHSADRRGRRTDPNPRRRPVDERRPHRGDSGYQRTDRGEPRFRRDDRGESGYQRTDRGDSGYRRGDRGESTARRGDRANSGYQRTDRGESGFRRGGETPSRRAGRTGTASRRNERGEPTRRIESVPAGPSWDGEIVDTPKRKQHSVTFAELGLPDGILDALADAGIEAPFPIQAATLPDALAGRDVLGRAQTGSGKTLAFGLALLTRLAGGRSRPGRPRALVLVPTRELAMQVEDALRPLAKSIGLWCRTVVGGMSFTRQADQLQRGVDLLIATPGRLSDHVRQGTCVLDDVRFTALDEADQMADMGFLPQVRAILDLAPGDGQRMLFSATLDKDVAQLVDRYLTDPVTHSVSPATAAVDTMDHHLLLVSREDKQAVVAEMAARDGRTIMFLRTKHHVDRLTRQLRAVGVRAGALHGGKPQGARNRVLGEFRDGSLPVLIATDVAARGIHVDGISLVVHVDPPADAKGYLHRAGRTARAGETGTVVTLVTNQERRTVFRMTEQAGVQPARTKVTPGDADLVRITGARIPSGDPVVDPEPTRRPPRTGKHPRGRFGTRPRR